MFSRSLAVLAISICLAPCARFEQLTVSGVSQISHFDTLTLNPNGSLTASGFVPARVQNNGKVEMEAHFKASAIAGARLIFQGKQVAKINGQGAQVVTLAGLPVGPKWLPNLLNPPPKDTFQPMTLNDQIINGESTTGPNLTGLGGDVCLKNVKLQVNFKDFTPGTTMTIPNQPVRVEWHYWWDSPKGKRPGTVSFEGQVLGHTENDSREYTPPGEATWWNRFSYTPTGPGKVNLKFKFRLKAKGDTNPSNNSAVIEGTLIVADK